MHLDSDGMGTRFRARLGRPGSLGSDRAETTGNPHGALGKGRRLWGSRTARFNLGSTRGYSDKFRQIVEDHGVALNPLACWRGIDECHCSVNDIHIPCPEPTVPAISAIIS